MIPPQVIYAIGGAITQTHDMIPPQVTYAIGGAIWRCDAGVDVDVETLRSP